MMKGPKGVLMCIIVPSESLATAMAFEWMSQDEYPTFLPSPCFLLPSPFHPRPPLLSSHSCQSLSMTHQRFIMPDSLPITRLATMAIDQMPNARQRVINQLMHGFETDLTWYSSLLFISFPLPYLISLPPLYPLCRFIFPLLISFSSL